MSCSLPFVGGWKQVFISSVLVIFVSVCGGLLHLCFPTFRCPNLVDFGVSSIRLGSRHWEQKCFLEFRQFDVFSIGLICLNFMSCLLLCYSMFYRPSMIRYSKSRLRWWHHVKDPVTTPPANHKDGMDIEQPAGNSLHHRWKGTNHVSYLKNLFAGPHHIRRHLGNRPAVSFCLKWSNSAPRKSLSSKQGGP